jgi:hypothetical protein
MHHKSYDVYLFEHILIAVKKVTEKQPASRIVPVLADYRLRTICELKGRVFLPAITRTDLVGDSKLRIYWCTVAGMRVERRSRVPDPSWETFTIYFERPEVCRRWIDLMVGFRIAVPGITMAMAMPAKAEDDEVEGQERDDGKGRRKSVLVIRAF